MKLVKSVPDFDLSLIKMPGGWDEDLDEAKVARLVNTLKAGRVLPPAVIDTGCALHWGRHRFAAYQRAGLTRGRVDIVDFQGQREARISCLEENLHRVVPEGDDLAQATAELVDLYEEEHREKNKAAPAQEPGDDAAYNEPEFANSKSAKSRGRKKTDRGAAIERAAEQEGVTPAAIRKRVKKANEPKENTEPVDAEMLKPMPSMDKRLGQVSAWFAKAGDDLAPMLKELESLKGGFGKQDGRWALLGALAMAVRAAKQGQELVGQARAYRDKLETAQHKPHSGLKAGKQPIPAFEVATGRDSYQASQRPAREVTEDGLAAQAQHEAKLEEDLAPPMTGPSARARAEFARRELLAREAQPSRPELPTTPDGEPDAGEFAPAADPTLCTSCDDNAVADGFCHACGTPVDVDPACVGEEPPAPLGLSAPPRVGLKRPKPKIRTVLVDHQGNEMPYEEALAQADAAGVAGGPPEETTEPEGGGF